MRFSTRLPIQHLVSLAVLPILAGAASAQMTPVLDLRQIHVKATLAGDTDEQSHLPAPPPFSSWDQYALAEVYGPEAGSASAEAYQNSLFFPSLIYAAGSTAGQYQVLLGSYEALSLSTMVFEVTNCIDFTLDATMQTGDLYSEGEITLGVPIGAPDILKVLSGEHTLMGRLSPGQYFIEGRSSVATNGPSMAGPTYALVWSCQECLQAFIGAQPQDLIVPNGSTAVFTVGTTQKPTGTAGAAALTLQWRKNRVPLTDDGHVAGATTTQLSIFNVTDADTGWYDVVVSDGSVDEPSRYAHLTLTGTTGVDPGRPGGVSVLAFEAAYPNPSSTQTSFRFVASEPVQARAGIYDAAGRLVQPLGSRLFSGSGVLSWDGLTKSGEIAPAGIYFLRVQFNGVAQIRRFVRVR